MLGCGGGGYEEPSYSTVVTGKITKGGQPLTVNTAEFGDYARIEMTFLSLDTEGLAYGVTVAQDGTFELQVPEEAVVSGKFRVAVAHFPDGESDALKGKFGEENSPIEVEITPGQEVLIDLDQVGQTKPQ